MGVRRNVLLVQLPIPPLGPDPIRGNVPLAAGYLKLFAEQCGLGEHYNLEILPGRVANMLGDRALVAAIADRDPWLVGFTCYVWNIERTLWIAHKLMRILPNVRICLGGPEITPDNAWVLDTPDYDFAAIGEGEQTFSSLLVSLRTEAVPSTPIPGLYLPSSSGGSRYDPARRPAFRTPMPDLNQLGSPYLAGILDAAEEEMLLLETTRGCVFKCKFCYYPKSYDKQYYLAPENILANLNHAQERGAREVFLLDPTLNQRKDFADLLRLLARGNPGRQFSYFGELRGEGISEETARLLREANFTEVEVGLQSIDPHAQEVMDRKNNLRAFERGVRAMLAEGIEVKVDLIIGLPGDTVESVRRGLHYLRDSGLYSDLQIFNLSILPGTAFRQEAGDLGLKFQPRPPYYLLRTPTLRREDLYELMQEAQETFGIEFDLQPPPVLDFEPVEYWHRIWRVDLDDASSVASLETGKLAQAFTIWLKGSHFARDVRKAAQRISNVLGDNPFTTLQVVLEPAGSAETIQRTLPRNVLEALNGVCQVCPTYLDRYYALQPGRPNGAKRLIALLPAAFRARFDREWIEDIGSCAALVWRGATEETCPESLLAAHEYAWVD
ncbi:MAG TPA: B12-binding domain-containing radical SAM protein [Gemmataceae bacterium]|nr:B12-binding domain-containing radical SAM protein [Gemmataceae bacterium]